MGATSGPGVSKFKRFLKSWSTLDCTKQRNWVDVVTEDVPGDLMKLLEDQLHLKQHRDDYQEL